MTRTNLKFFSVALRLKLDKTSGARSVCLADFIAGLKASQQIEEELTTTVTIRLYTRKMQAHTCTGTYTLIHTRIYILVFALILFSLSSITLTFLPCPSPFAKFRVPNTSPSHTTGICRPVPPQNPSLSATTPSWSSPLTQFHPNCRDNGFYT